MSKLYWGLRYGLGRSARGIGGRAWSFIIATSVIGLVLAMVAIVYLTAHNVRSMTDKWGGGVQMVVYLEDGVSAHHANRIAAGLRELQAVTRVTYIPPQQALSRLRSSLGKHQELADGIEPGMLPGSLEVSLRAGVKEVAGASPIIDRLRVTPGVDQVEFLGEWVGRVSALVRGLQYAAWMFLLMVACACVYVVIIAIRSSMSARADELAAYELLGAAPMSVRGPIVAEGVVQGVLGAGVAVLLAWGVYTAFGGAIQRALTATFGGGNVSFLAGGDIARLLFAGALFGAIGSWLATSRYAGSGVMR